MIRSCTALYYYILCCIVLYCIVLYCIVIYPILSYSSSILFLVLFYSTLKNIYSHHSITIVTIWYNLCIVISQNRKYYYLSLIFPLKVLYWYQKHSPLITSVFLFTMQLVFSPKVISQGYTSVWRKYRILQWVKLYI